MLHSLFQYYSIVPAIIAGFENVWGILLAKQSRVARIEKAGFPALHHADLSVFYRIDL